MNNSNYPWFILVPTRKNITELYELEKKDRLELISEIDTISKKLSIHFNAKKMNIATLGNIVPQLHIHIIVRQENDAAWPNPVWNNIDIIPYKESISFKLVKDIRKLLGDLI
jgi:diadenosine tetraphosphate (Ap4A) HIT family hydrolase